MISKLHYEPVDRPMVNGVNIVCPGSIRGLTSVERVTNFREIFNVLNDREWHAHLCHLHID